MIRCAECSCFVPPGATACPDCDLAVSPIRRAVVGLAMIGASAATAMTLMACYGAPYDPVPDCTDNDSDGYCVTMGDCDDTRFDIRPGAIDEAGDGVDQNCDGVDGDNMGVDGGTLDSGM